MKKEFFINSLPELGNFAESFLASIISDGRLGATVVALSGDLGAGKTTLVQTIAKKLGITETVTSPTFTIMKSYPVGGGQPFSCLVHLDAYRIEKADEIPPLRLEGILNNKENLVCIEWAQRIKNVLPPDTIYLELEIMAAESRKISIS